MSGGAAAHESAVTIVQARLGSSRLPGKSLLPIGGMPLLELILRRLLRSQRAPLVVLAIPDAERDTPLAELAGGLGVPVIRGPETDVLARFAVAMAAHPSEWVVRVCADNPFVAPEVVDAAIEAAQAADADYLDATTAATGMADGIGVEVIRAASLAVAAEHAGSPEHREHVTGFLRDQPGAYRSSLLRARPDWAGPDIRLDVDYVEDHLAMGALAAVLLAPVVQASAAEVIRAARAHPDILKLRAIR